MIANYEEGEFLGTPIVVKKFNKFRPFMRFAIPLPYVQDPTLDPTLNRTPAHIGVLTIKILLSYLLCLGLLDGLLPLEFLTNFPCPPFK
jgi:hypothetical protein